MKYYGQPLYIAKLSKSDFPIFKWDPLWDIIVEEQASEELLLKQINERKNMPKFRFKLKLRESEQLVEQTLFKFQKEEP